MPPCGEIPSGKISSDNPRVITQDGLHHRKCSIGLEDGSSNMTKEQENLRTLAKEVATKALASFEG